MLKFLRENALIIYPFLLIGSFYCTWFAARYYLGHYPVASVDDPKSINGFWMWTYEFTYLLAFIGLPAAILMTTCEAITKPPTKSKQRNVFLLKLALGASLITTAYWIMGNEPNDILGWLLD